jgi:hypothetical protein
MTTEREQKIAAKVAQFPSGMAEGDIADVLNAPDTTLPRKRVDVATSEAREILLSTGEWGAVVLAAENTAVPQQVRGACIVLRDTIAETSLIRASVPAIYNATATLLGGLILAGVLTEGTRDALMALADVNQSWAEQQGVGTVEIRDIGIARGNV